MVKLQTNKQKANSCLLLHGSNRIQGPSTPDRLVSRKNQKKTPADNKNGQRELAKSTKHRHESKRKDATRQKQGLRVWA